VYDDGRGVSQSRLPGLALKRQKGHWRAIAGFFAGRDGRGRRIAYLCSRMAAWRCFRVNKQW